MSFALVAALALTFGLRTSTGPAVAQAELSSTATETFSDIRRCLSQPEATLNALFLLDASSSLREDTDPENLRSQILAQALDQLGAVSENRDVNWAVVKFDLGAQVMKAWEQLTPTNVDQATDWAQSQDSWWGAGQGTDWLSGLDVADQYMREVPPSETNCKMMIWLTDGGVNVDGGRNPGTNAGALEQICGRDPVTGASSDAPSIVNSIRSSGTHLIGVLLKSDDFLVRADSQIKAWEESSLTYMLPITEGAGQVNNSAFAGTDRTEFDFGCGEIGPGQAGGALLLGSSPISLAYSFADLANGIVGGTATDLGDVFPVTFTIEPGINYVGVQLAGAEWQLTGPDGSVIAQRGQEGVEGVRISQRGDLASVQVTGDRVQAGEWSLNVVDSQAGARLYTDIRIQGITRFPSEFKVDEPSTIRVEFVDLYSGELVPASDYSVSPLTVTVEESSSAAQELECELDGTALTFTCPFTPSQVGSAIVVADVEVGTPGGKNLTQWSGEEPISVLPPANFPSISPAGVGLSPLDGRRGVAEGQLTLLGPQEGAGAICFPERGGIAVVSDVIDRATAYAYDGVPFGECVEVQQGESLGLDVSVTNGTAASGFVELALPVTLLSDESANEQKQTVRLTFETIRQGSPPLWLVALLIVAGFAVPIALLYAQARSAARLSLKGLQQAVVPVTIGLDGTRVSVTRQTGGELFQLDDWQYLPAGNPRPRSFSSVDGVRVQAVIPKNPVGPIRARVVAGTGSRVITSEGGTSVGKSGNFGLMPASQWFMVGSDADLASDSSEISGTLVGFANPSGGALADTSRNMTLSVQDDLIIGSWETLRSLVRSSQQSRSAAVDGQATTEIAETESASPANPFDRGTGGAWPNETSTQPPPVSQSPESTSSPFDDVGGGESGNPGSRGTPNSSNPFENL